MSDDQNEKSGDKTEMSRRAALARLGIGVAIAYSAPTIVHLDRSANATLATTPCSSGRRKPRWCKRKDRDHGHDKDHKKRKDRKKDRDDDRRGRRGRDRDDDRRKRHSRNGRDRDDDRNSRRGRNSRDRDNDRRGRRNSRDSRSNSRDRRRRK